MATARDWCSRAWAAGCSRRERFSKLVKHLGIEAVPHGFRSSFRDWAAECSTAPREVCELALAHVNDDQTEAAYRRSDLFDLRRKLMEDWEAYLENLKKI